MAACAGALNDDIFTAEPHFRAQLAQDLRHTEDVGNGRRFADNDFFIGQNGRRKQRQNGILRRLRLHASVQLCAPFNHKFIHMYLLVQS